MFTKLRFCWNLQIGIGRFAAKMDDDSMLEPFTPSTLYTIRGNLI